jgi:hypothetical protein
VKIELLQNIGAMLLHGVQTQLEHRRDFFIIPALGFST